MPGHNEGIRRDSKHRVLRRGESVRPDGRYQFKYSENGKAKFLFRWRLEPTDKLPPGKTITVNELIERYIQTKTGVRPNTRMGYQTVINLMKNEEFGNRKISDVKTSDAKLFLIKLQEIDNKTFSTIHT